ncbi:MAG TPA: acylphosphatase [Candidatus Acidoferrales bacterium]|nr:acylphosphatase [Candidatus Acidoferrales bacterium]
MQEKIARRYFVSGMVQGVGYRFFATRLAERLGVAGWVKNLADGRVEVYAIATRETLKDFRLELERAPRGAMVEDVREEDAQVDPEFARRFTIEHDRW